MTKVSRHVPRRIAVARRSGEVLAIYLVYWYKSTHTDAQVRYMLLYLYADAPHPQRIHARLPHHYSYFCTNNASKVRGPICRRSSFSTNTCPAAISRTTSSSATVSRCSHFTCFTSTKVKILTRRSRGLLPPPLPPAGALTLLAVLVQKYTY